MFRRFWPKVLLLLATTLPAAAQTHVLPNRLNFAADAVLPSRLEAASELALGIHLIPEHLTPAARNMAVTAPRAVTRVYTTSARGAEFRPAEATISASPARSEAGRFRDAIAIHRTPFGESVRVPMLSGAGGRFAVDGYYATSPMENVLMGLPGSGSLPARGIGAHSHLVERAPQSNLTYGLSLTMRLGKANKNAASSSFVKCLGGIIGRSGRS